MRGSALSAILITGERSRGFKMIKNTGGQSCTFNLKHCIIKTIE